MHRTIKTIYWGLLTFLPVGAFALTIFSGCGLFSKGTFITDLYGYFPKDSSFYAEFKPSEQDARRMLSAIDKFAGNYDAIASKLPAKQASLSKQAGQVKQVVREISQAFEKDFQSQMALGYWVTRVASNSKCVDSKCIESTTDIENAPLQEHSLAVLPLKAGIKFETIRQDLKLTVAPAVQIKTTANGPVETYTDAAHKLTYAIVQNNLLIAQDKETLGAALEQKTHAEQSVIASDVVSKNLGRLTHDRNGTIIFQQNAFIKAIKDKQLAAAAKSAAQSDLVSKFVQQIDNLSPGSVGGLKIDTLKQLIALDMYTPMDFSKIENQVLRGDLESFYTQNGGKNLASILSSKTVLALGVNGFNHLLSLYENIMENTPDASNRFTMIKSQLKAVGLDWQQNIVDMFKDTTALALTGQAQPQPIPNVTLLLNNSTGTQKTFDVLTKRISPLTGTPVEKTFNGKKLNVLSSPLLPSGISFGDIGSGLYVLGMTSSVQLLPSLSGGDALNKNKNYEALSEGIVAKPIFMIFADWKGLLQQFPQLARAGNLPLEAILVTGSWDAGVSHGQFRVKLDAAQ